MPRTEPQYQPTPELTQVHRDQVTPVAPVADVGHSRVQQLLDSLGVAMPAVQQAAQTYIDTEQQKAQRYARSVTVEELNQQVQSGELMESHSPTYVATLRHIHGENGQRQLQTDTLSKLQEGSLKFTTNEDLDAYLTSKRNEFLQGQDKYTVAGFDKSWDKFRNSAMSANAEAVNNDLTRYGFQQATDALNGVVTDVTGPMFKGSPEEAAGAILSKYSSMKDVSLLRDDRRKAALGGVAKLLAQNGQKSVLEALLKSPLDNGVSVTGVLGNDATGSLLYEADSRFDKKRREDWRVGTDGYVKQAYEGSMSDKDKESLRTLHDGFKDIIGQDTVESIIAHNDRVAYAKQQEAAKAQLKFAVERADDSARQAVEQKVEMGMFMGGAGAPVMTLNNKGEPVEFDQKATAKEYLRAHADKYDFNSLVAKYAINGLTNDDWKKSIATGAQNLYTVGIKYDGKTVGELSDAGKVGLDLFTRLDSNNPDAAKAHAGEDYNRLHVISQLVNGSQNMSIQQAASLLNQAEHSGISDEFVKKEMHGLKDASSNAIARPSWYSGIVNRAFGSPFVNTSAIDAEARDLTELYLKTRMYTNAADAYEAVMTQQAKTSTVINNTIYPNKSLPEFLPMMDKKEYMEEFIKTNPGSIAESQKFRLKDVSMIPTGTGTFMVMAGKLPLADAKGDFLQYTKEDISAWANGTYQDRVRKAMTGAQIEKDYPKYRDRIEKELKTIHKTDPYYMDRNFAPYASASGGSFGQSVSGMDSFKTIRDLGWDTLPLTEIVKKVKERNAAKRNR